jgi:site-specific DNA-cytosine methylase
LPQQKIVINTIIRSHQGSLRLVETLLDVYRNETEGLDLNLATIDLANLAEDETTSLLNLTTSRRIYIDLNFQRGRTYPNSGIYSPCLNTNTGLWNVKMGRYANCNEYLMLQGFPKTFKRVVSISQFKKQIGNSMSVNVLEEIFRKLIR